MISVVPLIAQSFTIRKLLFFTQKSAPNDFLNERVTENKTNQKCQKIENKSKMQKQKQHISYKSYRQEQQQQQQRTELNS